jgi:hypothetical protein
MFFQQGQGARTVEADALVTPALQPEFRIHRYSPKAGATWLQRHACQVAPYRAGSHWTGFGSPKFNRQQGMMKFVWLSRGNARPPGK